jgi:uncharacterized lipoprotein YajG
MEIRIFSIVKETNEIEDLLNDDKYDVKKLVTFGKDNNLILAIIKPKEEQLTHEGARLGQIQEVANSVRADELYSELRNANQRCLYLLDKYHIPKSIALDVIDEVKVLEITEK